jgi:glycosyltransferase involved in cell wall biosynthesis
VVPGAINRGKLSVAGWVLGAARRLAADPPRVIHCVTPLGLLPALLARPRLRGARIVCEYHAAAEFELEHAATRVRRFFTMLDTHAVRRADAVLCMNRAQVTYLQDRCGVTGPVRVSWGPIALGPLPRPPRAGRPRVIGYFGNAHHWQGLGDLLEAFAEAGADGLELRLGGVGPDELPEPLPAGVTVLGRLDRQAMLDGMAECDVLVSPRRGGQLGNLQYPFKLSAYLAAGRPVIGTDVSDQGEIIRVADCGQVVPAGSSTALVAALKAVAAEPAERLREQGENARRFAEDHLGLDRLRHQLSELYRLSLPVPRD